LNAHSNFTDVSIQKGNRMTKFFGIAAACLVATISIGAVHAQGANPNAPQPNSTGTGVYVPGTSPTGQAIDAPQDHGQSGVAGTTGKSTQPAGGSMKKETSKK
jgi:hypothetical protein